MANEFVARNGIIANANSRISGTLDVSGNITTNGNSVIHSGNIGNQSVGYASSATQVVTLQDAPPTGVDGKLWWETDTGKLKVYYGSSSAWIDALPMPDMTLYLTTAGGSISGDLVVEQTLTVVGNLQVDSVINAGGGTSTQWNTAYSWGNHASQGYATQTYVNNAVANLVDSAPGTLDTLNELAAALGDDPNFATTVSNNIATKLPLAGGTMTGQIVIPSIGTGTYEGGIQFREAGYVNNTQFGWGYSPGVTFHWGNVNVKRFGMRSDGQLAVDDAPIALQSWVTSQGYITSYQNNYISDVRQEESNLIFTGQGSAFNGTIDLSGLPFQPAGSYLTAEADTLATVTSRGASTSGDIYVNGILTGGLGAVTTSGTLDWNHSSNARAGQGYTLLLGSHSNGPGPGEYFHPVGFEYSSKNGGGNVTQLAISYGSPGDKMYMRGRYDGSWTGWTQFITSANIGSQSVNYATTAGTANAVAWTNVSSRPTSLSEFTNNLTSFPNRIEFQYSSDRYSQAWRNSSTGAYWWVTTDDDKLGYHRNGDGDKFYFSNGGDFWSATNGWLSTALAAKQNASTAITTSNIGSQSVSYASSAGNADTTDGLHVHGGRNNEANKIVRTDGNGYAQFGWINTDSGVTTDTPARFYGSDDGYLRYYTRDYMKMFLGGTFKYVTSRKEHSSDSSYWTGVMGWGTNDWNDMFHWGSGFLDSWSSPANQPPSGDGHHTGLQVLHYTNGTYAYGWQMAQAPSSNEIWHRGRWGTNFSTWRKLIDSANIGSQSVNYASTAGSASNADTLDGYHASAVGNRHFTARGFYVDGDENTYYPVIIGGSAGYAFNRYSIYRHYGATAPWDPIGTGAHKGGLTFDFEWSGDPAWGGNDHTLRVVQFSETYTTMVAGLALPVTSGVCVWLRGGHAYYEIQVDGYPVDPAVYLDGFTAGNGAVFSPRTDTSNVTSEIYGRMPLRSSSDVYDNNNRVIHAGGDQEKSGYLQSNSSLRAPIFYDSQDTGFYVDPNSNSRLSQVYVDNVYNYGWFRNYGNTGIYNQDYGTHFYSYSGSNWAITGSGSNIYLAFRSNHESTIRGYVHANTDNSIGFLNDSGNWTLRTTSDKNAFIHGQTLTINADNAGWSSIYMNDGDEGMRELHCNSNRIGFLTQAGAWGAYADDSANWFATGYIQSFTSMYSPVYYDGNDSAYYGDFAGTSRFSRLLVQQAGVNSTAGPALRVSKGWDNGTPDIVYDTVVIESNDVTTIRMKEADGGTAGWSTGDGNTSFTSNVPMRFYTGGNESSYIYSGQGGTLAMYISNDQKIGIGTSDFSYTANDNTPTIGSTTDNRLFVRGSIQLLSNDDAIVIGRSAATFLKDEELGFGWGGGWYMTEGSYIRSRGGKSLHMNGGSVDYVGSMYLEGSGTYAHLQPNSGSYGTLQVSNTKNGWAGIRFTGSNVNIMANANEVGFYNNATGWQFLWSAGTAYVYKGETGSGTQATVLDSSNYSSWAQPASSAINTSNIASQSVAYADRARGFGGYPHAGYGMMAFYNWGGSNGGADAPNDSSYTVGISVGSHPSDQAYGFQIARNMWNTGLWTRGYDSGWGEWVRLIDSSNIGSQSVNYASSAGNADTVDGYHATNAAGGLAVINANGYWYPPSWINVGGTGIYSGTNNAHFLPNQTSPHGSWEIIGSRGGWSGIYFRDSANTLMANANESGFYNKDYGWQFEWSNGTLYCNKNAYGGGPQATVLDSSNFTSWAATATQGSQGATAYGWGNHSGLYIPINPDADGPAWAYSDENPTINGTYIGGRQSFGADGDAINGGALQARLINALEGHVNSSNGYYVGTLDYGGDSGSHDTQQVIDGGGNWVGNTIGYASSAGSATQVVTIQDTPPSGSSGKLWWESDTGKLKVYYGTAWVDASPIPDMSVYYSKAGGTISGDVVVEQTLTVVGNTLIQGTLTETSDARLKENVAPLQDSLDKVLKLNGVSFNKIDTPNVQEIGFIAQEVEEVLPELVTETDEGIKTVSYSRVTAVLVETIKEQQAQIDELKALVNTLSDKLNSL